jgi:hypothetical protein
MSDQALFKNPHDALMYAFNYSSQQYALSPMAKLMKLGAGAGGRSGKGLVALDGAAQAGIIRSRVEQLPALQRACIVARYAPRFEKCPCCDGDRMTDAYREAVSTLAEWAISRHTGMTLRNMRGAIVRSFYERGVSVAEAAKELGVSKSVAYVQKSSIHKGLKDMDLEAQRAVAGRLEDMCEAVDEKACAGIPSPV